MKKFVFQAVSSVVVLIFFLVFLSSFGQMMQSSEPEEGGSKGTETSLPSSLNALYPPQAEQPVYLFKMIGLATPLMGIIVDLAENDFQNVKADFEEFRAQYIEISKLVAEWEKNYPLKPVDELGKSLESGEESKVMAAYEKVIKACHDCHVANMVKVQQKYHWGDFRTITAKDPLTNQEVNFTQLMQYINVNFVGIGLDLVQGQKENAQKQLQGFKARYEVMKETCEECHGAEERKYYTDENVDALIDKLEQALGGSTIDPKEAESLIQAIGMESCFKCHLVHVPAALSK